MDPVVLAAPPWDAIGAIAGVAAVLLGLPALVALFVQNGRRSGRMQQGLVALEQRVTEVRDTVNRRVDEVTGRLDRIEGKLDRHLEFHATGQRAAAGAEPRALKALEEALSRLNAATAQRSGVSEAEAAAPEEWTPPVAPITAAEPYPLNDDVDAESVRERRRRLRDLDPFGDPDPGDADPYGDPDPYGKPRPSPSTEL